MGDARRARAWGEAALLGIAPWLIGSWPFAVPLVLALALLLHAPWRRGAADPLAAVVVALSAAGALATEAGWGQAGAWALLALVVAAVAWVTPRTAPRPDAADLVALLGWGGAFLVAPASLGGGVTRALAALLLVVMARRALPRRGGVRQEALPGPPAREVEGWLRLEATVAVDGGGLPASRPLTLELEPGAALAVLVGPEQAEPLAALLAGRRAPAAGRLLVDGHTVGPGEDLAAVVAAGEPFVPGSLEDNLQLLVARPLAPETLLAAREACCLEDVETVLEELELATDGAPLSPLQRLRVLAARALVSDCRLVVALDPAPWGRPTEVAAWHAALVRASVGRTAVWFTSDRSLAARAQRILELGQTGFDGAVLQALEPAAMDGGGSA